MTASTSQNPQPIALLSVTDKTGIVAFAKGLAKFGYRLLSTGGTAKILLEAGLPVEEVADYTKSPEILGGRVKTLHPLVHGGILFDRQTSSHQDDIKAHGISPVDLVVVNLYDFASQALAQKLSLDKAIEFIDIGGPTMLRAAAKNYRFCMPVIDPNDYDEILAQLQTGPIANDAPLRQRLAAKVFASISSYDRMIASYFASHLDTSESHETSATVPETLDLTWQLQSSLRYGENPKQVAGFYSSRDLPSGLQDARVLQGKALSYNNYLDVDAAMSIVSEFGSRPAVAIIKHTNPCGAAMADKTVKTDLCSLYQKALAGDPQSAFGGIVATNQPIDAATAEAMSQTFLECIAAPGFEADALEIFGRKKNLRLLELPCLQTATKPTSQPNDWQLRSVQGGLLVQSWDRDLEEPGDWQQVSQDPADANCLDDLLFAWTIVKHVKSNAIVFVKDRQTIAVGAGQMSRVDSVRFAIEKAKDLGKTLDGAVLASDAFFPFRDSIDTAAQVGVKAIVQPGGSIRDEESIKAANEHRIAMYFTGNRHFRH